MKIEVLCCTLASLIYGDDDVDYGHDEVDAITLNNISSDSDHADAGILGE